MSKCIHLEIPWLPVGPNGSKGLLRMHWTKRRIYFAEWVWKVKVGLDGGEAPGIQRGEIWIHQYRTRLLDEDNLVASCKPVIDALRKCNIIVDDSPDRFSLRVTQEKGGGGYITVNVVEREVK